MNNVVQFKTYLDSLSSQSNDPASMADLLKPFGIELDSPKDKNLLIGHVLDCMAEATQMEQAIDCFDVLDAAAELGMQNAEDVFAQIAIALLQNAQMGVSHQRVSCS
jgi:hypothetical protein